MSLVRPERVDVLVVAVMIVESECALKIGWDADGRDVR